MRIPLLILLSALFSLCANAQPMDYQHKGLYVSLGLGPVAGTIHDNWEIHNAKVSRYGPALDFKIGGSVGKSDLIFHISTLAEVMIPPTVKTEGAMSVPFPAHVSIAELMIGGGATYFFMPANIFISTSIGFGRFVVLNAEPGENFGANTGLAMQFKAGKEWWVRPWCSLGIAAFYNKTYLNEPAGLNLTEALNSNRYGLLLNTTFHRKKV